jgi:hypothetical protein
LDPIDVVNELTKQALPKHYAERFRGWDNPKALSEVGKKIEGDSDLLVLGPGKLVSAVITGRALIYGENLEGKEKSRIDTLAGFAFSLVGGSAARQYTAPLAKSTRSHFKSVEREIRSSIKEGFGLNGGYLKRLWPLGNSYKVSDGVVQVGKELRDKSVDKVAEQSADALGNFGRGAETSPTGAETSPTAHPVPTPNPVLVPTPTPRD